jgi:SAM-dependent methyltransferase
MRDGLYGPPPVRRPVIDRARQSARLRALDLRDTVSRRRDRLTPPRRLDFVGHSDFAATGDEFMAHFVELGGLQPHERVLDVGCGIGRMARPLAGYLSSDGAYEGFDVNPDGIAWCRRRYRRHPGFGFQVADIFNARYNPAGAHRADEYRFPYEDATFDFVLATSVFTHLLEADAANYLAECARVLAPGGRLALYTIGPPLRGTPAAPEPLASHVHLYTDRELAALVEAAGFRDVAVIADDGGQLVSARI